MFFKNKGNIWKGGKRKDLNDKYFRSAWEANYARILNLWVLESKILSWKYENKVFIFDKIVRGNTRYMPDFEIINIDNSIEYVEIKGYMDASSKTKLSRMAKYYPEVKLKLIDKKEYNKLKRIYQGHVENWE